MAAGLRSVEVMDAALGSVSDFRGFGSNPTKSRQVVCLCRMPGSDQDGPKMVANKPR